ncbi:MAG: alanine dehydrogenase [Gammaproteobacteria bacterium]|nr:alanine dehydrogenase [Gammaproteobacteria bacterium]
MHIGIPKETKLREGRVAIIPTDAARLLAAGHTVSIETGAGVSSGFSDSEYSTIGVQIAANAAQLYAQATLIVKVKEPISGDLALLRSDHLLFSYLHLAAEPALTQHLCNIGLTAIAFETVTAADGSLPLLAPMSAIAGRVAVQVGAHALHQSQGGRGILLGGLNGTEPGHVVILGAGVAGHHAAQMAIGLGAHVTLLDKRADRLSAIAQQLSVQTVLADEQQIAMLVQQADLLIGAVLIPGARAPIVVSEAMVKTMRSGSVIADISVDQGGCIATTRPTTYADPLYTMHGVQHFTVTNMPGAVPRTAAQALSAAITPYVLRLANNNWQQAADLKAGVNVQAGKIVHPALLSLAV